TSYLLCIFFFFQAEDGIRDWSVTGVQTCAMDVTPRRDPGVHREVALRVLRNARGDLRARRRGERPPVAREAHVDVTGAERERHARLVGEELDRDVLDRHLASPPAWIRRKLSARGRVVTVDLPRPGAHDQ